MSFRQSVFWNVLMIVSVVLILLVLSVAVLGPKPEPLTIGKAEVLPLTDLSIVAAMTPPAEESPLVKYYIDASYKIVKYQKITGWLYIENQPTENQKVYVQLEKPDGTFVHYSTMPMERPDVGATFNNPLYNESGFSALFPLEDGLDIDACTVRFVVNNDKGIYKSSIWRAGIGVRSREMTSAPFSPSVRSAAPKRCSGIKT